MTYFWLSIIILAIAAEAMTTDMVAIWFMPAALVAMILSAFDLWIWLQVVVFFVLVVILLILSEKFVKKALRRRPQEKTNADSLIGQTAIVTEKIDNEAQSGAVRIGGLEWSARTPNAALTVEKDTLVIVREIAGVKLICEPK